MVTTILGFVVLGWIVREFARVVSRLEDERLDEKHGN